MVSGTLYTYPGSFRANKILIAAAYSGSNVTVDPKFEYGKTNTSADFLKKFPLGKVPAFESNNTYLNESDAIAQYVSNEALLGGSNAADQAAVREYASFSENEIVPSACTWVFPTLGFKQYNKQDTDDAMNHLKKCLEKLNNDLLTKTFLVGERVTLADITLCTSLVMLYVQVLDPKFREAYVNVNRWFETCINQPNFKNILGEIKLCEKMATFDNKRYQELHPKGGKEKAKKEQKPKEKKPKAAAEPAAPAPAAEKPVKKDYFADVPKSEFVLDTFKKFFMDDKNTAEMTCKYLEDNMDFNAYSMWYCEQDDARKDQTLQFKASNLANGFLQRIEGLRKHSAGVLAVYKEDSHFFVSGVWIFRGQTNAFERNPDWNIDAANFRIRKLDFNDASDKKLLMDQFYAEDALWSDYFV